MRREQRLRKARDFAAVYRDGRNFADRLLVLRLARNDLERNRYGFVASRAIGKAVARNRVRRRLREVVRGLRLSAGWDLAIIVRKPAAEADYHQLERSLTSLVKKAGIVETGAGSVGEERQEK